MGKCVPRGARVGHVIILVDFLMIINYRYFEAVNSKEYNLIRGEQFNQFTEDTMPKPGDHRVGAYCGCLMG